MGRKPVRERILFELLDAERDTLTLCIDGKHRRLDLLALLVVAHGFFAGQIPGDVGEVHKAIDAAVQTDKDAEVGDRLDLARHLVVAIERRRKLGPRVRLALLDAERNTTTLLVDLDDHDLDFLADRHDA